MLLMALHGLIKPLPNAVIFADTGNEPDWVYTQVEFLKKQCEGKIPFYVVGNGNIYVDAINSTNGDHVWGQGRWEGHPVYTEGSKPLLRKCTRAYKITPSKRMARKLQKIAGVKNVITWMGHTMNEIKRLKPAKVKWQVLRWPLVELRLYNHDLVKWLNDNNYPQFKWSACITCPFVMDDMDRVNDLRPYKEQIIQLDESIRDMSQFGVNRKCFLNRANLPMKDVFELAQKPKESNQLSLFDDDVFGCDSGICGL